MRCSSSRLDRVAGAGVGTQPWLIARVAFEDRPPAIVPAVAETLAAMLVPLTIFVAKDKNGVRIDRSQHYLVDEAQGAFDNRIDLHQQPAVIDDLASAYAKLQAQAHAAGLQRQ